MPGFRGLWERAATVAAGSQRHYSSFRKTPAVATIATQWFDFSMSPGFPVPQYYAAAPLTATQLSRADGGMNYGPAQVAPAKRFLNSFLLLSSAATPLPMPFILCDYLLYYPFIDTGSIAPQVMTNSSSLSRYTSGDGVQMMAVSVAPASGLGGVTFEVSYTNQAGASGRISQAMITNTATSNGAMITAAGVAAQNVPFIGLQGSDSGVRSIESVTITSGADVGLFTIALVKPLLTSVLLEQTAPSEILPMPHQAQEIEIQDNAYLNLIGLPNGSVSGVGFFGELDVVWN